MSDNVLIALVVGLCTSAPALVFTFANSRSFNDPGRRIDDSKETLRAEMRALRAEMLEEIGSLNTKIENLMKHHLAEYHK